MTEQWTPSRAVLELREAFGEGGEYADHELAGYVLSVVDPELREGSR